MPLPALFRFPWRPGPGTGAAPRGLSDLASLRRFALPPATRPAQPTPSDTTLPQACPAPARLLPIGLAPRLSLLPCLLPLPSRHLPLNHASIYRASLTPPSLFPQPSLLMPLPMPSRAVISTGQSSEPSAMHETGGWRGRGCTSPNRRHPSSFNSVRLVSPCPPAPLVIPRFDFAPHLHPVVLALRAHESPHVACAHAPRATMEPARWQKAVEASTQSDRG